MSMKDDHRTDWHVGCIPHISPLIILRQPAQAGIGRDSAFVAAAGRAGGGFPGNDRSKAGACLGRQLVREARADCGGREWMLPCSVWTTRACAPTGGSTLARTVAEGSAQATSGKRQPKNRTVRVDSVQHSA